jgi:hypothetical protein
VSLLGSPHGDRSGLSSSCEGVFDEAAESNDDQVPILTKVVIIGFQRPVLKFKFQSLNFANSLLEVN